VKKGEKKKATTLKGSGPPTLALVPEPYGYGR